ncbi:protein FAM200A-like [Homarus americanus]|uniref:protein FAM200A-like n=1 Tax=Homarus americanus TaxID=6706 RepID=UPI001C47E12B|nr:protein FAM200A-like [Homarus americanus]
MGFNHCIYVYPLVAKSLSSIYRSQYSSNKLDMKHLSNLHNDLSDRFIDLKQMNFPSWIAQPFLFNWENNDCLDKMESDQIDELMDMQNDDSMKRCKLQNNTSCGWIPKLLSNKKKIAIEAQQVLLPFPATYLVECAFSAVMDMLTKKRGRLNICERGDLGAKLTGFVPRFSSLVSLHAGQSGH